MTTNREILLRNFEILKNDAQRDKSDPNNKYRIAPYNKIMNKIRNFEEGSGKEGDITIDDLPKFQGIPGVGIKTIAKMKQILETSSDLKKVSELKAKIKSPDVKRLLVIELFEKILGVGEVIAAKWYKDGYTTLEEVKGIPMLTNEQKLGIEFFDVLQEKIPRIEICFYESMVKTVLREKGYYVEVCGSYRRGEKFSNDMDFIIGVNGEASKKVLEDIVAILHEEKVLVYDISLGDSKYRGLAQMTNDIYIDFIKKNELLELQPPKIRRFDIHLSLFNELPFALLYFTGSKSFNTEMRNEAKKLGYKLNERNLLDLKSGKNIPAKTEKDVFDILGMAYKAPEKR